MRERTKLINNVENFLQTKKGYKKSWVRSFLVIILCAICFGVVLGISYNLGPMSGKIAQVNTYEWNLSQNGGLLESATYISIAGICIMVFPFICGMATWMIGINQVTKSKYFHLFIWIMVSIAVILAIIAIIFLIRASIFNINEFPNTEPPAETPPPASY